jgi:hypothetical protein
MATNVSASLSPINPNTLFSEGYELADQSIIPNENITAAFVPFKDKVEYWVYDFNKNLVGGEYNFTGYNLAQNPSSNDENDTTTVELSPINDLLDFGFDTGQLYTVYNFVRYQLSSTPNNRYYIAEISSDRTELRLKSNIISNEDIFSSFQQLKSELNSSEYFDEFYITFGDNEYNIGVNIELDTTGEIYSVLVKLYDALPPNFGLKNEAYVVTKVAESVGYQIEYPDLIEIPTNITLIQGPNTNIEFKDFVNNSTELKSKTELTSTNSSTSGDNLANILNRKGVTITPNYSYDTFNEFVNFSSAKKRIENFVEKVRQIQVYEADITTLSTITGPTSQSTEVTTNIASAYTNIETLVKNFDGYEYFLYYNTGSSSYPKSTSTFPYTLYSTTDTTVLEWLGSDVEGSQYYGGILLSASLYDSNNQNWLYYTIPEFIRENSDNDQYLEFSNMVGQHFDEIWLYTKTVSEKLNTTSDVDSGVPLQLADDVITSLGYKGFSNNYNNQNNFIGLTGENSGSYVPPTGSELITDYIAVNNGEELFQYGNFINQHISSSFPYAIDKVSKEIYKRLYHNMAYLTKKKGTISGLRQLINIWGIPNTILRINEFGGKNKDNSDDYDLWYNRYNYTFKPLNSESGFAQAKMPWLPLQKNFITEGEQIVPDCIQFRFKTNGAPGIAYTSSLLAKKSDDDGSSFYFDFGIQLAYSPPTTGSYLGAGSSEYENWGTMRLVMSGSTADGGDAISDPIYLPFFDKGWWSVMLQRDTHVSASDNSNATTYTLYAKNNIYNGWDGNQIGFEGSASIVSNVSTSINEAWNKFGSSEYDTSIGLGADSRVEVGSTLIQQNTNFPFSGSFQEFRYYSAQLPETVFNDYVMNPESIEGVSITGPSSSFSLLNFRAALGNELESTFISPALGGGVSEYVPIHPSIVGSTNGVGTGGIFTTQSFYRGGTPVSIYYIDYPSASAILPYSTTNTEVYFLDQPAAGVRNRISNKIKIDDGQDFGNTLSSLRSIQQNYQISRSYTEDINSLEVSFSPQDEINDDIIQTFGFGVISDVLADPRFLSSSDDYYPGLRSIAKEYFEKYSQGNIYDYLRLIKYFDNSIFKAIKNYVPARTSVSTGIVIKQHLLERNRRRPVQLSEVTKIAVTPSGGFNTPIVRENLELTSSIDKISGSFSGGTGGVVEKFNYTGSLEFGQLPNTQSWENNIPTVLGLTTITEDSQKEFYDGEYSGSTITATTQSLLNDSSFDALLNNVSGSRLNSYLMKVEYEKGIVTASNNSQILNRTAQRAATPDSNYTSKRSILPRYEGSKVSSANYNYYTSASSGAEFRDGSTGSWSGDNSYGKTAVIDKNPIYFGHFKYSYNNPVIFGMAEFLIDQLIEVPFEDIQGTPIDPKILKIEGDNSKLIDVASTFEVNRKASIAYEEDIVNGVDYQKSKNQKYKIFNPTSKYAFIGGNQPSFAVTDPYTYMERYNAIPSSIITEIDVSNNTGVQLTTGSGYFNLSGSNAINVILFMDPQTYDATISPTIPIYFMGLRGPCLSVAHSYNYCVANSILYTSSSITGSVGVTAGVDKNDPISYFKWGNIANYETYAYEIGEEPFLIERGDEIRVSYISSSILFNLDFQVLGIGTNSYPNGSVEYSKYDYTDRIGPKTPPYIEVYNKIFVHPDPSTLTSQIPNGEIFAYTIRKREDADNVVNINKETLSGSYGAQTKSGGGYLIPNDLTDIQKRNIDTLITQLKAKNNFNNNSTI